MERIPGTTGPDELMASMRDTLLGGAGDDTLDATAGGGLNWLVGQEGNDELLAGSNDRLLGGPGDDNLFVGSGGAQMLGGPGADGFWIFDGEMPDRVNTVRDFEQGTDVLGLRGLNREMLRSLRVSQVNGTDTLVQIEGEDIAILKGVSARTLTMDDFFVAPEEPEEPEPPEPQAESLLEEILDRGMLRVAVTDNSPGFSFREEDGSFSGIAVDFSRAIATALFDDPDAIEYVVVDFEDGFSAVADGDVDLSATAATQNTTRDATLGVDYSPIIFYDGQGILVPADSEVSSLEDLEGLTIGVVEGFTSRKNLLDALELAGVEADLELVPSEDALFAAYEAGEIDAISVDRGIINSRIPLLEDPENQLILSEVISREPLGLLVPENESQWADVVRWVVYTTFQAEEFGIDSDNVEDFLDSSDPALQNFLGSQGDLGVALGLENDFTVRVIEEVGNYGEIYARNFDEVALPRGQNRPWTEGGLLYSLPFSGDVEPDFTLIDNDDRNVLEEVLDRGFVIVGTSGDAPGLSLESDGEFTGLDVDFGRAIAAAIFGDPDAVEFVIVDGVGLSEVANGEVDVLSNSITHNLGRDAGLGVDYAPITVYDNQVIVSDMDSGIDSLSDLDGRTLGVEAGTTSEQNILDILEFREIDADLVTFESIEEMAVAYVEGEIDAATGDSSQLASVAFLFPPEIAVSAQFVAAGLSKEPLAMVVDENQSQWKDIVSGVAYTTIQAQSLGITSENVDDFLDSEDPVIRRFLGVEGTVGRDLGLPRDFVQNVLEAVGNIDEMFDRNFPPEFFPVRNPIADLSENGGLLYSPPFA